MKEEILAAVMFLIKFIEKSESFPHDQIENFKHHLTTLLLERFEKHWFPERPARGQGYRCIRVNGVCPVDGTLERAASRCGLRYRDLRLPQELTVWVDPTEVCYRLGESEGSYCTLATFPDYKDGATTNAEQPTTLTSNSSSSSTSTLSSDSALSSSSSTTSSSSLSSSGSDAGSDCASLSSRSPSPLAAAIHQQQQQQQVYQGPVIRRSPFAVNGVGGGRLVRGAGVMQPQMTCRAAVNNMQTQQQQQRFMVQMGTGNRLKPRELGYNVQQHVQQPQQPSSNNSRTVPSVAWRPDGQHPTGGFVPPTMYAPMPYLNHHGPPQFGSQLTPHFGRTSNSSSTAIGGGPNGVPTTAVTYAGQQQQQQQRMYKNVVRV